MALNGGFFDERPKNRTMESEEKDQTVHMCSLILFYTHWKVIPSSPTAAKGLKNWRDVEIQFFAKKIIRLVNCLLTINLFSSPSSRQFNPLPHMPVLGSSNSAANKVLMSKILTNGDTIF